MGSFKFVEYFDVLVCIVFVELIEVVSDFEAVVFVSVNFALLVQHLQTLVWVQDHTFAVRLFDDDRVVLHDLDDISTLPELLLHVFVKEFVAFQVEGGFDSLLVVDMA